MAKKKQIELTIEEKLQNALVPKEEQPYKIPNNWCWVRLGNITQIKGGKRIPKGTSLLKENTGYKYIRVTDMKNGTVLNDDIHYISKDIYNKISNYTISKNDIYITCAGTIGRVGIIPVEFDGANLTENADKIIIKHINKNLLVKVLSSYIVQKQIQEVITTGCQPKLAIKKIEQLKIPLPPINEQQRIVERIESLFVKLDRAKELIENTLAQFEQNKMAILHKAFIGELTAKWRKENNIDLSSWQDYQLKDICEKITDGTHNSPINTDLGDYMYITAKNIKEEGIDLSKITYVSSDIHEKIYARCNVEFGDVLYIKDGATTGIATINTIKEQFSLLSSVAVLKPKKNKLLAKYLVYKLNSNEVRNMMINNMSGVAITRLTLTKIKQAKMKFPTIEEQQEIVNILDNLLAKYNKIKNLEQQLEKIELLKKAILAKAFRGELGTNNPDEESAENLLKEILAEK
ncbi:restriction endonuclease subunit S [Megamonas funiformis]|uniref:restriction endonuclease subunit S n=1 Tax=Megamonas funiformis TaxID=437897 RepID=UPI001CD1DDD2|nr:restriction endonuclease subunit S [Megamonas funiformis]UBS48590.1 restriction endonuclease subunit S [Megamonas funiformis]GLU97707.1 HsdS polypeptide [Megamonas funiformis]